MSTPTRGHASLLHSSIYRLNSTVDSDTDIDIDRGKSSQDEYFSPRDPSPPTLPFKIFDDEYHGQQSLESDIPCSTRDTAKRRADKSLSEDQRAFAPRRVRSHTIALPPRRSYYQQLHNVHEVTGINPLDQTLTKDINETNCLSQPLKLSPPGTRSPSINQQIDDFWSQSSDDPPETFSNKRHKNELRGKEGRRARTVSWQQRKIPTLPSTSASLLMQGMSLTSYSESTIKVDTITCHKKNTTSTHTPPVSAHTLLTSTHAPPTSTLAPPTSTNTPHTPPTRRAPRRKPLSDISFEADILPTESVRPSTEFVESGEPIEPIKLLQAIPIGPLMTRQPRKGSTRERLRIINPFPMNPSYWNEYANDTLNYLLEIEVSKARYDRFMYMTIESEFGQHRTTLVTWLIEISYGLFGLQSATLHAGVNILDRYLSIRSKDPIQLSHLQGIGLCALMIASKLEEDALMITFPLCIRVCDVYSRRDLASMELSILIALKFEILVASATGFSDYFKRAIPDDQSVMELTDALWIALCSVHQDWSEELAILTGYTRADLTPCSLIFKDLVCNPTDTQEQELHRAFRFKYHFAENFAALYDVLK
ncbi:hypothetical protein BGZ46_002300 [Entomortierella lignicola]|nr:hypothetical protein BGZ46_002300 [Entomortierella lignicola]